jgi:hypothetical protein
VQASQQQLVHVPAVQHLHVSPVLRAVLVMPRVVATGLGRDDVEAADEEQNAQTRDDPAPQPCLQGAPPWMTGQTAGYAKCRSCRGRRVSAIRVNLGVLSG